MVSLQTVLATYIVLEVEDMVVVVERDSLEKVLGTTYTGQVQCL